MWAAIWKRCSTGSTHYRGPRFSLMRRWCSTTLQNGTSAWREVSGRVESEWDGRKHTSSLQLGECFWACRAARQKGGGGKQQIVSEDSRSTTRLYFNTESSKGLLQIPAGPQPWPSSFPWQRTVTTWWMMLLRAQVLPLRVKTASQPANQPASQPTFLFLSQNWCSEWAICLDSIEITNASSPSAW